MLDWIKPSWSAPVNVRGIVTTRSGGYSAPPWDSMNLSQRVGDSAQTVDQNRQVLQQYLANENHAHEPVQWLNQVHGVKVVEGTYAGKSATIAPVPMADAIYTTRPGLPIAVLTADCLPVFFCDELGTQVAVAHAGWRGLSAGVLEQTAATFSCPPEKILTWFGPAIGPRQFEVGDEVRHEMIAESRSVVDCEPFFVPQEGKPGYWRADLYGIAQAKLNSVGITYVAGGNFCTVSQAKHFYSYRRDNQTGRMASVIWLADYSAK